MLKVLELPNFSSKSSLNRKLKAKDFFQIQSRTKYLGQTLVFHVKWGITGKVQFLFFKTFLLVLTKFSFW